MCAPDYLPVAAICTDLDWRYRIVFAGSPEEKIRRRTRLMRGVLTSQQIAEESVDLSAIEVIFATWGFPRFSEFDLARLPKLKAVFYAAGSVKAFAEPLLSRGIKLSSAWKVNAIPVSEFTLAQIIMACKGFLRNSQSLRTPDAFKWRGDAPHGPGVYNQRVALIGMGAVGRRVLKLMEALDLTAVQVESHPKLVWEHLQQAFKSCLVVSNHLADRPEWKGIYDATLFRQLPEGATFINTGRGAQVNEEDLITVFKERPDLTAVLDVTDPEPPAMTSPLRSLPNVYLSSHISGSINHEIRRMADYMIGEFDRWVVGEPLMYEVTKDQLPLLA